MTFSSEAFSHSWVTSGTADPEALPFPFLEHEDMIVTLTAPGSVPALLVLGDDYTISGDSRSANASLQPLAAWTAGQTVTAVRRTSRVQLLDLVANEKFAAEGVEYQLDRQMMVIREVEADREDLESRALRVPAGETVPVLPALAARVGLAGWDGAGGLIGTTLPLNLASASYITVTSRALMAALANPITGNLVWLEEGSRSGLFRTMAGAAPAADPQQGLYVTSAVPGYHYRRVWNGIEALAEWFGAKANDALFDNLTAIQACLNLCPATRLGSGDYYLSSTLVITKNGTRLTGAAHTQTDQNSNDAYCTRIVCTSATDTIIRVGATGNNDPRHAGGDLTEAVVLEGFSVDRSVNPYTPPAGLIGCIGIDVRWCVNCYFERVFSLNSCIGWNFYGTVQHFQRYCSALREKEGSNPANDVFIAYYVDQVYHGTGAPPYNGANASLRLLYCRAFAITEDATPALTYSAGVYFAGGWVDTDIIGFETGAGIQYGIYGAADGYNATSYQTENLKIAEGNFDPGSIACIWFQDAGSRSAITIEGNYFATTGTAIHFQDYHGSVSILGNQFITPILAYTGISLVNVAHCHSVGNIFTGYQAPHDHTTLSNFYINDIVNNTYGNSGNPAVNLTGCSLGEVAITVNGIASAYTVGVNLNGAGNAKIEVACSRINGAAIAGGSNNKLKHNGAQITVTGAFGTNCLASGIMA